MPKVLQQKIIRENHDVLAIGHMGLNRTMDHIKRAFLVAWYVEHRGRIHAILSGLSVGEIRPQEKGVSTAANPTTGAEMVANYYRLGHGFAKV